MELINWGKLNAEGLRILYEIGQTQEMTEGLSKDDIKFFLTELDLVVPIHFSQEETALFVPSLINDANEDFMRSEIKR